VFKQDLIVRISHIVESEEKIEIDRGLLYNLPDK